MNTPTTPAWTRRIRSKGTSRYCHQEPNDDLRIRKTSSILVVFQRPFPAMWKLSKRPLAGNFIHTLRQEVTVDRNAHKPDEPGSRWQMPRTIFRVHRTAQSLGVDMAVIYTRDTPTNFINLREGMGVTLGDTYFDQIFIEYFPVVEHRECPS